MDRAPIPDDVRRFILLCIPSVPYLEAMLLLRNEMSRSWTSKQVAHRLYMSERAAVDLLLQLGHAGIVAEIAQDPPLYCYEPNNEDIARMINGLAEVYSRNLIGVTNLIHAKSSKKAQQFADAFKWRKET
ncbi:hypothetical protein [Noviherbaspirillum sp. ST9]|uniref:hypothetical protein n=1 Tax=Noviherbaspirillum sp. ST9 TaxID=3401606 RepID=UPI003B5861A8